MLKLETVNGFARIMDGPIPFVDIVFSHSPDVDSKFVATEKVRTLLELAEKAPGLELKAQESTASRHMAEADLEIEKGRVKTLQSENSQMRQAIAELKRELADARMAVRKDMLL